MAYENLKNAIKQVIKNNNNQEITGDLLQSTLLNIVNTLGAEYNKYKFLGFASPSTVPPTSEEGKLFYFASEPGEYINFHTSAENTHITIGEGLCMFTKEANSSHWKEEILIEITQNLGEAEDKVISQKAVSDKLNDLRTTVSDKLNGLRTTVMKKLNIYPNYDNIIITKETIENGYVLDKLNNDNRWVHDTRYLSINEGDIVNVFSEGIYKIGISCYDENFNYINTQNWKTSFKDIKITVGNTKYIIVNLTNEQELSNETFAGPVIVSKKSEENIEGINIIKDVIQGYWYYDKTVNFVNSEEWVCYKKYINVIPNQQYHISNLNSYIIGLLFYDKTYNIISSQFGKVISEFTTPSRTYYIKICFKLTGGLTPLTFEGVSITTDNRIPLFRYSNNSDKCPNFNTTNNVLSFPISAVVNYNNKIYPIADNKDGFNFNIPMTGSSVKVLVFDTDNKSFSITTSDLVPYNNYVLGWFTYNNGQVVTSHLPFEYTINNEMIPSYCDVPIIKFGNTIDSLPNINTAESKFEFPKSALVHYGKRDYPLDTNYGVSSYSIPTEGDTSLRLLVFNKKTKTVKIIASKLVNEKYEFPLGWFLFPITNNTNSYWFPFSVAIDGVSQNSVKAVENKVHNLVSPYYLEKVCVQGHLYMFNMSKNSADPIFPSQTIFDIQSCARLGIKSIEANVHETATSGKYIVMHGVSNCVGYQMMLKKEAYNAAPDLYPNAEYNEEYDAYWNYSPNGSLDKANGHIPSTSFEDLRNNYFNRSVYPKFRVPITSLEEFLYECKKYEIFPVLTYIDEKELEIIKSIMGDFYGLRADARHGNSIHIYWDHTKRTPTEALALANKYGRPFIYGIDTDLANKMNDEEIKGIIDILHRNGYIVMNNGNYYTEEKNQKLLRFGIDGSLSGWHVPYFTNGNLYDISSDIDFSDFTHNGNISSSGGTLILSSGQTIKPNISTTKYFLAKEQLSITFKGKIKIKLGKMLVDTQSVNGVFESDGTNSIVFSSGVLNSTLQCNITAIDETKIISMEYKASKV